MNMFTLKILSLIAGCSSTNTVSNAPLVPAIVDDARSEHFFNAPFPSNSLLDGNGHVDLSGYPQAPSEITRGVISGWARRITKTSQGFANNGAA